MPMARRAARVVVVVLAIVPLALVACVTDSRPAACEDPAITIELTLSAETLTPSNPGACRDQEVTLVVEPEIDGVLHIHGYDDEVPATEVTAGQEIRLELTARRSGQFPIELHTDDAPQGTSVGIFTVYEP